MTRPMNRTRLPRERDRASEHAPPPVACEQFPPLRTQDMGSFRRVRTAISCRESADAGCAVLEAWRRSSFN